MHRLIFGFTPLMDKAGDEGGAGGAGTASVQQQGGAAGAGGAGGGEGGEGSAGGAGTASVQQQDGGESAAAAIAKGAGGGAAGGEGGEGGAGQGEGGESAAAAIAKGAGGQQRSKEEKDVDLANTSDEDYAKLVQPDVEGQKVDRSLITPMAKELKEAGIQPRTMATILGIYRKAVGAAIEKDEAAREARMKEMRAKCLAEVTDDEAKDFAAAYNEHIVKDAALQHVVDHTELGSNPAFIRLIALAGATLRVERTPPASATAGSSLHDTDRGVYEATVPKHLR